MKKKGDVSVTFEKLKYKACFEELILKVQNKNKS